MKQRHDLLNGGYFIGAVGLDPNRTHRGSQQHDCDDIARAHASPFRHYGQIAVTVLRNVHDSGTRLRVQPARAGNDKS